MSTPTWNDWKKSFKDAPQYFKDGCINTYNYWKEATLRMWVVQITWLIIVVAMFYYGIHGMVNFYENTDIDPHSALGFFVSWLPLYFVFAFFMIHWAFSSLVKIVFDWMDNRADRDNT